MFVRVYDKLNSRYYKSIVYGTINVGWFLQYIVLNPLKNCFELVEYLDKSIEPAQPLVETIQRDNDDFIVYENALLLKYKHYCKKNEKYMNIDKLCGYTDVCENFEFIADIIDNKSVLAEKYKIKLRQLSDKDKWDYIQTQEDANEFMKLFVGFHDSTLDKLVYVEEHGYTGVTAIFDNSGWYGVVELCFEGLLELNIRPAKENYDRYIYEATMLVENETVFWADGYMENEDPAYNGSYIKAMNLKWRKIV
ncbi:hypothetical protein [Anaeromicropila herbilytica]|uniref:Uncharacterized protein n=1 Tax=Anaeromicropila herbilytica TaxID=2785025 RepID=A0A7R7ELH7_9FIRM|nr:hypothetical protein [Anaeromicropila herbilytica]BCN30999.1 hypothetical protein bsdtb5_22940 [Anaeromicropila herbilytica]